jgi:raffinose/stachyose/melibiose transport system permease protein
MNFFNVFKNSFIVTGVSLLIIIVIGSMAAYPISRIKTRLSDGIYMLFTAGMLIPIQVCMVPMYKLMVDLKLINNLLSCILVYSGAWMTTTIFMYVGFVKTIPVQLDEAAYIDGATKLYTFWRIIFPLLKPINATISIITLIGIWNDFLLPLLYLQRASSRTIQLGLYAFSGIYGTDWTGMFSAMMLSTGPVIIIYVFLNKYIIKGIVNGAVKG